VVYHVNFQLETVTPAVLHLFQQELKHEGQHDGLFHSFDASGRMKLGGQSFMHLEMRQRSLLIKAFHTFPDDCAIVKSESMFELPS
jgi:Protein of unknown function DUF2617